jgi:hypothetical protein
LLLGFIVLPEVGVQVDVRDKRKTRQGVVKEREPWREDFS